MERTTDICTHRCAARVVGDINLRSFVFYVLAETHPTSTTLTMAVRWTHIQTDNLSSSYKAKHARVANYCVQLPLLIWYHNLLVEVVEKTLLQMCLCNKGRNFHSVLLPTNTEMK